MRKILFLTAKVLVSIALLYFALRKIDFVELFSRLDIGSAGWITLGVLTTLLQVGVSGLRWREITAQCGAPLSVFEVLQFNLIGAFFNQTLPSSIGGDAMRLWLVHGTGVGWRASGYSVFVDRAIGMIALALVVAGSLPWSYELVADEHGRYALIVVNLLALAGGLGFLFVGCLQLPFLKRIRAAKDLYACAVVTAKAIFSWPRGVRIMGLSLLVHTLTAVTVWCAAQSIDAPVLFAQVFCLIPPVMLITMVPISIAGWGVREAAFGLAFGFAGLSAGEGVGVSLLFGVILFVVGIIGGVAWIFSAQKSQKDAADRV